MPVENDREERPEADVVRGGDVDAIAPPDAGQPAAAAALAAGGTNTVLGGARRTEGGPTTSATVDQTAGSNINQLDAVRGASPSSSAANTSDEKHSRSDGGGAEDNGDPAVVDLSDDGTSSDIDKFVKVGPRELFRFATKFDLILNIIGLIAAAAAGAAQPLMTIVFGSLTTEFLNYQHDITAGIDAEQAKTHLKHTIAHNALLLGELRFPLLTSLLPLHALIFKDTPQYTLALPCSVRLTSTWPAGSSRRGHHAKDPQAYLKSVLRQDIAYFDLVGAGEVTTRIQSDIQLIQEGISDKLPISVMFIATFIAASSSPTSSRGSFPWPCHRSCPASSWQAQP
ncbi:hypothetical protein L7F22_042388 [Adiantum nelumboides]|nr:hypothetical protein [Adiantum nelumboides]